MQVYNIACLKAKYTQAAICWSSHCQHYFGINRTSHPVSTSNGLKVHQVSLHMTTTLAEKASNCVASRLSVPQHTVLFQIYCGYFAHSMVMVENPHCVAEDTGLHQQCNIAIAKGCSSQACLNKTSKLLQRIQNAVGLLLGSTLK